MVETIRAHWPELTFAGLLFWGCAAMAAPQTLEALSSAYRSAPTPARQAELQRYAAAHSNDVNGALARLALGTVAVDQKDYPGAIEQLSAARPRLARLADYVDYYLGSARLAARDFPNAASDLAAVARAPVSSPLGGGAAVLAARALAGAKDPQGAVRVLRDSYAGLPQPDADLALADTYQAAGDLPDAALYYQKVYFGNPSGEAANKAAAALLALQDLMGEWYPPPLPSQMLGRGDRLLSQGEYSQARKEFETLVSKLGGTQRDQARVRLGAADYLSGQTAAAFRYLNGLSLSESEADAERLYYIVECARRLGDDSAMMDGLKALERRYAESQWRFRALVSAGRRFLLVNQPDRYEPLFEAAAKNFPDEPLAAYCHWKITWYSYLKRDGNAEKRLREHVERFPGEPTASSALYFLGRLAEADKNYGVARAYYEKIDELFPNYYYGVLARERLTQPSVVGAQPSPKVAARLSQIPFPNNPHGPVKKATPETNLRIERARLLKKGGFEDWAEAELRFGIRNDSQPCLLAMELAGFADTPHQRLRYMKSAIPGYLSMSLDDAPMEFWELLFPLPYRADLMRNAKLRNLDPFIVAGLIRQESEFNPQALSRARAYGLTQVLPATGRHIARRAGVRRFSTRSLFHPATNLKLGTYYLRTLLDQWGGKWEETLASYNAGKTRVDDWLSWGSYREPAEFVESIPFTETREYVQAVLRNAAVYRELYEKRGAKTVPAVAKSAPAKAVGARKTASSSKATAGRKRVPAHKRRIHRR